MDKEVKELLKKIEEKEKIIKKYEMLLKRFGLLEDQENKKPSEALECLEDAGELSLEQFGVHIEDYKYLRTLTDEQYDTIKQALLTKSKKEQAFDVFMKLITSDNDDPELSMEIVLAVACLQTFGEQSEEFKIIKEVLNISEEEYNDYVTKYCKKENEDENK